MQCTWTYYFEFEVRALNTFFLISYSQNYPELRVLKTFQQKKKMAQILRMTLKAMPVILPLVALTGDGTQFMFPRRRGGTHQRRNMLLGPQILC